VSEDSTQIQADKGTGSSTGLWTRWPLRVRAGLEFVAAYLALVAAGLTTGWVLLGPLGGSQLLRSDLEGVRWLTNRRTEELTALSDFASGFTDTRNVVVIAVLLIIAFTWAWQRWRESLTLMTSLGLEASVFLTVSLAIGRTRPPVERLDPSPPTASFPSGHSGAATALYVSLAIIVFWNTSNTKIRAVVAGLAGLICVSVALSRVYRGMHYPTDVVIGLLLGLAAVLASVFIVRRAITRRDRALKAQA
jgi:membrane-associated phospholipid phosphatase